MKQLRFFDVPLEEWNRFYEIREAKECLKVALKHRNELRDFLRDYEHLYKWGKAYFKREKISEYWRVIWWTTSAGSIWKSFND